MNTVRALLFAFLLCVVSVSGRHHGSDAGEVGAREEPAEAGRRAREGHLRRRRKRWQAGFGGYEYHQPAIPFYENERRDHYNQQDLQLQIFRLLDELTAYVRRPPPPPQPIYIPYPVPYAIPQTCQCGPSGNNSAVPGLPNRFPEMADPNQNWGQVAVDSDSDEKYDRPISFVPITPDPLDQVPFATSAPASRPLAVPAKNPGACDAAVVSCCRPNYSPEKQLQCFRSLRCGASFTQNSCSGKSVKSVLELFAKAYAPVDQNL
ncbi:uncharacterized protein LOC105396217 [Plutella xylostella]|uniref:uncharacterized protein LOC105396217 n=1 Tax=Plutella xylostella TaxID=51655 RepID=UPI002032B2F4|nr:uncharacterized protein LOC105396217 [Plutella xylostella]